MRIGEVASHADVNVQTLRYYERRGLVQPSARSRSGYRVYEPEAVRRILFIKRSQQLGFTLNEIESLLDLREGDGSCVDVSGAARAKIEDIDERIRGLQGMRRALESLVVSCESEGSPRHCPLLEELEKEAG